MVDIHCHILYGVDDGAASTDISKQMLSDAAEQGITDLIVTPHYRQGMFAYDRIAVNAAFDSLYDAAKERGVRIYPGCEYHVDDEMVGNLRSGRCPTLACGDYVLAEFGHAVTFIQIRNSLDTLLLAGYIPVIAHAERCETFAKDVSLLQECKNMGAKIQINADSILGRDGSGVKKTARQILKQNLADIVASDCHNMDSRKNHMEQCRDFVAKEYGWDRAWELFTTNPLMIVASSHL